MNKFSECDLCRYFRVIFRVGAQNGLGWIWCEDDSKDNDVVYEWNGISNQGRLAFVSNLIQ